MPLLVFVADLTFWDFLVDVVIASIYARAGFPNSSISAIQNQHCLISIVFPTPDLQGTITNQYILCLKEPETDEEIKEAEDFSKLALTAIEDEDYPMNFMIQDSIESKANTEFMFGKNEPIQQHYHHWVDKLSK